MQLNEFVYQIPDHLIARYPTKGRSDSRLLRVNPSTEAIQHSNFSDLTDLLNPGDLLVLNDTKVIPARVCGTLSNNGTTQVDSPETLEVLIERIISDKEVLASFSKSPRAIGDQITLKRNADEGSVSTDFFRVLDKKSDNGLYLLSVEGGKKVQEILELFGKIPLPSYLNREAEPLDKERYQTIFAEKSGSVAAPTAALHFDAAILKKLVQKGVELGWVTLHISGDHVKPIATTNILEHRLPLETVIVSEHLCQQIKAARARKGRVIAVSTSTVRALETAVASTETDKEQPVDKAQHAVNATHPVKAQQARGVAAPFKGETDLFITPGFSFKVVDALLTNFHLPASPQIMLVCAFGGRQCILSAYEKAIQSAYRFYGYGDAMFIEARA